MAIAGTQVSTPPPPSPSTAADGVASGVAHGMWGRGRYSGKSIELRCKDVREENVETCGSLTTSWEGGGILLILPYFLDS